MTANDPLTNSEAKPTVLDKMKQIVGAGGDQAQRNVKFKRVHIIVNPASGQQGLNLPALNKVLKDLGIEWEMFVTRKGGEACERAKQAVEAGVDAVVVYGGDGTVLEVASGMSGSNIPFVILPGGTANVLSVELGIPPDQTQAALLLGGVPNAIKALDMGELIGVKRPSGDGDLLFFHLGEGLEGTMHENADRDAKDRSGMFAYITSALKTLANPGTSRYRMTIDGEAVEVEGVNCMVTNFGSVGVPGITLSHAIDISDGRLDVIVIQNTNIASILSAAASAVTSGDLAQPLMQWQAKEVTIVADPPQPIVVDGELVKVDKVSVRIVPQAVRVVVPGENAGSAAQ